MALLNSKFDILRGWPNSSAVAEDWVVPTIDPTHDPLNTGSWVRLNPLVPKVMTCKSELKSAKSSPEYVEDRGVTNNALQACPAHWGLVIEGQDEYSSRFSKRVTVLMGGGYVVRLWNDPAGTPMFVATNMAPGRPVALFEGLVVDSGNTPGENIVFHVDAVVADPLADPPVVGVDLVQSFVPLGRCLRVDAANHTCDIYVK